MPGTSDKDTTVTRPDRDNPSPPAQKLTGETLDNVAGFVRGTLGCGCPAEVLESIQVVGPAADELPSVRLQVGGRLLILLAGARECTARPDRIEALAAQGRAERDAGGYNRFRLVLVTTRSPDEKAQATAEARFLAGSVGDDRSHLHWVDRQDVPQAVRPV